MTRWDDIRFFLAVARAGSLGRAAQALGVDHSTVVRRLQAVENSLQARLFVRAGKGRELTNAGRDMLLHAERMEATLRAIELQVASRDHQRAGTIKVSTPDGIAVALMPELVHAFRAANPEIRVELITGNTPLDLAAHEADIELRPTRRPMREARGRKIARIAFGVYGAPGLLPGRRGGLQPGVAAEKILADQDWILPDPIALPIYAPADWMRGLVPPNRAIATVSSAVVMRSMVEQGLGIACLPCYLVQDRRLQRLMLLEEAVWGELWLLTHRDLSRVARVRAFLDHATVYLMRRKGVLEGRAVG